MKEKGIIQRSLSALRQKRKRSFAKGHSQRWKYKDYSKMKLGEQVQIDHITATKNGICLKHFQAWDRHSKYIAANVYSNAKASSAKRFLMESVEKYNTTRPPASLGGLTPVDYVNNQSLEDLS